uniref:Uncharacterized protein n=1 Tax=Arundo donax TaxID=35708 RepID=A0A0A8ZVB6_ARUDO
MNFVYAQPIILGITILYTRQVSKYHISH